LEHASRCEGYWKRLLRSVKLALRKTVGRSLLTFDELQTVLCEVEARINDRPLTLVSSVAQDELALNPAQFLIGWSLATLPDGNGGARSTGMKHLLRRRAHQRKVIAHLWKRWRREYITTMNRRGKWRKIQETPRVGNIVLVGDPGTPRGRWPFGRILEVFTGTDGLAQSASVKTATGTIRRSICSLALLEPAT
ncbi:hypothetical protein T09_4059, partial [Trichinella sp. T9]